MEVFRRNTESMREATRNRPEGTARNPEEMREIIERTDQAFREEMKAILNDEEYAMFLNTLPKGLPPRPNPMERATGSQNFKGGTP